MNKIISSLVLAIVIISTICISQVSIAASFQALDVKSGTTLYKKQLNNGNEAYLQVINLQKMQIDQIVGEIDDPGLGEGKYYRGEGKYNSPFFKRKSFESVKNSYTQLHKGKVFSIINCAFFEKYDSSTQLSFPIKLNGKLITAGSSLYGPVSQPAHKYYRNIKLKALVWDENQANITDYNPTTGAPLNNNNVKNAIVTYAYHHHPAKLIGKNQVNRYHVIGTLNKDSKKGNELLLIMTVNRATLSEASRQLRSMGVRGDIITIDGGSSTYLFNERVGNILLPFTSDSSFYSSIRYLPHYLGFRSKT